MGIFEGSKDPNKLAEPLGSLIRYAMTLAPKQGKEFTLTSGTRGYEAQVYARRQNCGTSHYDIYEKPASQCSPPTAKPGKSNHQKGTAADMGGSRQWAFDLLSRFDVKRPVPGEDWHYEWRGEDSAATLHQLRATMTINGFTPSEIAYVMGDGGTGPQLTQAQAFGASLPGWVPDVPGLPGLPSLPSVSGTDFLADLAGVAGKLTNPDLWRRLGWGAIGLIVIALGVLMVVRSQGMQFVSDLQEIK